MRVVGVWTRLEWRRRWRSLAALALLVALATGTVLAATAGARRGQTALGRLWARTLPTTVTVLPNQPGFDWAKIRALPEVAALTTFAVTNFELEGAPGAQTMFPFADSQVMRTIERPVVLQGRIFSPHRADEVVVTAAFAANFGRGPGDHVTLHLPSSAQSAQGGYDPSTNGPPRGPVIRASIVGVVRSFWFSDTPGVPGGVVASPALFSRYRVNFMGARDQTAINALVRLKGGQAAIPAFKADLARVSGRSDIDVWNNYVDQGGAKAHRITGYEAACLLAFGVAALVAAFFLVGQSVARYTSAAVRDLRVLQAVGLTSRQAVGSASAPPFLAALAGATLGVAAAILVSRWMPIGAASLLEPSPGFGADWLVLGPGWVLVPVMVLAGSAAAAAATLAAERRQVLPRRSGVVAAVAGAGFPVAAVVGTRFALEPGRGHSSVPVRPAVTGAIAGVLGILAAFTFSAGISDAAANPARFGQTNQLEAWLGFNRTDFGPAGPVLNAVAADRDVVGLNDARIAVAQSRQVSITTYTYDPVAGKRLPVVLTAGRMPDAESEVVLAPTTARQLHTGAGATIRLTGSGGPRRVTVAGIGFVPQGPHNSYDSGAWVTPALYDQLFAHATYPFKFHIAEVALRPGAPVQAVAHRLDAAASAIKGGQAFQFGPPAPPQEVQVIKDVAVLPLMLGAFLALLAVGAVGHALALAVRRRCHELAVLRALGMTPRQARAVVATQASVLAVIGLVFGVPLGLALGRAVWRVVADGTPMAYHPPLAVWALLLIGPLALLAANLLAAWPGQRATRLASAQTLRAE